VAPTPPGRDERDDSSFKVVRWAGVAHAMGLDIETTDRVRKRN
jgi:hypothetical protein